jgi:hypothetical protein
MFWMLLPPSANAGRHIEDDFSSQRGLWGDLFHTGWDMVLRMFASNRQKTDGKPS